MLVILALIALATWRGGAVLAAETTQTAMLQFALRPHSTTGIATEPRPLDALGRTDWFQGMWPTDADMPGKDSREFPRFHVEPVDARDPGVVLAKRLPMAPSLNELLPSVSFSVKIGGKFVPLYGGGEKAQIAYRVGNLLRLVDTSAPVARLTELIVVSHRLVLMRVRLAGRTDCELRAEVMVQAPDRGTLERNEGCSWMVRNGRGCHGIALRPGKSPGEVLVIAAYDAATPAALMDALDKGRSEAVNFDVLWQKMARPHSLEPFLLGNETAQDRNLIAACVNRVLRNARGAGQVRQPSMLEFFGPEWDTANAVWICFQPACRYALWIEPSFWANSMRTLLDRQAPDGRVPQAVYPGQAMDNSQIPNISPCLRDYYVFTHDRKFLADAYPRFKRWYEWWMKERNPGGDGIIAVGSTKQELMTSVYEYKDNNPAGHGGFMPLTRAPGVDGRPERLYLPDIVACQARMAEDLAFMARELGNKQDETYFLAEYRRIKNWANKNLWDEKTKFYYPVVRATGQKVMKRSNVAFWLLWAGIPDEQQAAALIEAMFDPQQFLTTIPLPIIALNDPSFDPKIGHWGDGYVWPIDVFHAFDGLLRYQQWDKAAQLAAQFNRGVFGAIKDSYQPNEFYHHSGNAAGCPIMGTAGCLPLMFQRYLKDFKNHKSQQEWARFAPPIIH